VCGHIAAQLKPNEVEGTLGYWSHEEIGIKSDYRKAEQL
jgi:hypothetical protein